METFRMAGDNNRLYFKNYERRPDDEEFAEVMKILKEEADIVCTNPPFSRAIDYWKILIDSSKKFIIISNFTNVLTPAWRRNISVCREH